MSATLRKAVIPAAGFGTRMLPAAKAIPKEMLPVLDRPTIQYVVEECAGAGLDDVLLIVSRDKKAVEDHFDAHPELESRLLAGGKSALIQSVLDLQQRVKVHAVRQPSLNGLGGAVLEARRHVGDEAFVCLLGDTIFSGALSPARQLCEAYRKLGTSIIGLERVAPEKVERYGIVGGTEVADGVLRLDTLIEKPKRDEAPSHYAIAARYVLSPAIFDCLAQTRPGKGGEIQLTDAIRLLLDREPVHGVLLDGRRHDIGNPMDWLKTNLLFASRDPTIWPHLVPMLRELIDN